MVRLIDYGEVSATLSAGGYVSLYYNSGAFGFPETATVESVGWILRDDPTLRPAGRALAVEIPGDETTLVKRAGEIWADQLQTHTVWLMPKSHWAYELSFASADWLPPALVEAGIHPDDLAGRHDGSAIAFELADRPAFERLVDQLLRGLVGSDFSFIFAAGQTVCTVHHHRQLWWTTTNPAVGDRLRQV